MSRSDQGFDSHRWQPVLALLAVLASASIALHSQVSARPASQSAGQPAAQSPTQSSPSGLSQLVTLPPPQATPEQIGDALATHQHYQAAIASYAKVTDPSPDLWNKMGIAYQMMFNLKDATRCYNASLKLDPRNSQVLNNLATVYDSLKQYGTAEHYYRKAIKLDPHSAMILRNLGSNLLSQHKFKKGWAVYQSALAIDPQIFESHSSVNVENPSSPQDRGAMHYYMARGCVTAGQTECALQNLRLALNEGYTNPKKIAADSSFAALRQLPAFQQMIASQSAP